MAYLQWQRAAAAGSRYVAKDGTERAYEQKPGARLMMTLHLPNGTHRKVVRWFQEVGAKDAQALLQRARLLEQLTKDSRGPLSAQTLDPFYTQRLLTEKVYRLLAGEGPRASMTWDDAAQTLLDAKAKRDSPKNHKARRYAVTAIIARIRDRWDAPETVSEAEINEYLDERDAAGLRPSSVNRELFYLRHLFQTAGLTTADGVAMRENHNTRSRFSNVLTYEQDVALLQAARRSRRLKGDLYACYLLLRFFGLRPSEAQYLTWDDVRENGIRIQAKTIEAHESHERFPGGEYRPKTKTKRFVAPPHAAEVIAVLRKHASQRGRFVLGGDRVHYEIVKAVQKALNASTPKRVEKRKRGRWTFEVEVQRSPHRPYDLRHTFCTWMLNRATPQGFMHVKKWMGHANAMTTEIYTDLDDYQEGSPTLLEVLRALEAPDDRKVIPMPVRMPVATAAAGGDSG